MSPAEIRRVVVADKITLVRRMLDGIGSLPLASFVAFTAEPHKVAAAESYLRRALEALLDLCRHVLAKGFGRAPAEYAEVARQLGEVAVLSPALAERLSVMARYRNRMVHFYDEIGEAELFAILTRELGDFESVMAAILAWMAAHPDRVSTEE